jgi:hypothetical protein
MFEFITNHTNAWLTNYIKNVTHVPDDAFNKTQFNEYIKKQQQNTADQQLIMVLTIMNIMLIYKGFVNLINTPNGSMWVQFKYLAFRVVIPICVGAGCIIRTRVYPVN